MMPSPEEIEELKSIGINLEALISMIKSQYELLKPLAHIIWDNIDSKKRHEESINKSIDKITEYVMGELAKIKAVAVTDRQE
jgi:hypothetical protein